MGHWRKMTWVFLVVNTLFVCLVALVVIGAFAERTPEERRDAGEEAVVIGSVVVVWFLVFVVLSLIWLMTRPPSRVCPVCGQEVKRGRTTCKNCGHDFAVAAALVSRQGAVIEAQDVKHWT